MAHAAELLMLGKAQTQTGELSFNVSVRCVQGRLSGNISRKDALWFLMGCPRV